jgi:hypothetical protein
MTPAFPRVSATAITPGFFQLRLRRWLRLCRRFASVGGTTANMGSSSSGSAAGFGSAAAFLRVGGTTANMGSSSSGSAAAFPRVGGTTANMGSSSSGSAAGCEAGLRPAVSLSLRKSGYAPRPGSARSGQGRTRGGAPLWIKKLAAGRSPASHPAAEPKPAAEPELEEPMVSGGTTNAGQCRRPSRNLRHSRNVRRSPFHQTPLLVPERHQRIYFRRALCGDQSGH